jgi:putative addiction module killer protein
MSYIGTPRIEQTDEYRRWFLSLRDRAGRSRIMLRVDRLLHGNPGDHRHLESGICELKIDFGPGYRVYYQQRRGVLLLLLLGGDKSTQAKDIAKAIVLAEAYKG